jgi:hypothetical protein
MKHPSTYIYIYIWLKMQSSEHGDGELFAFVNSVNWKDSSLGRTRSRVTFLQSSYFVLLISIHHNYKSGSVGGSLCADLREKI